MDYDDNNLITLNYCSFYELHICSEIIIDQRQSLGSSIITTLFRLYVVFWSMVLQY